MGFKGFCTSLPMRTVIGENKLRVCAWLVVLNHNKQHLVDLCIAFKIFISALSAYVCSHTHTHLCTFQLAVSRFCSGGF